MASDAMSASFTTLVGWHDVFDEVLIHLEPMHDNDDDNDDEDSERHFAAVRAFKRTLLSLALSSRALFNPSMNKLWCSLSCITPLLKLLPNYQGWRGTSVSVLAHLL